MRSTICRRGTVVSAGLLRAAEADDLTAVTSELTLAECLVKPFQTGSQQAVHVYEQAIRPRPWLAVVPVSREVLVEAARIRATSSAKLPDAIHVATYRFQSGEVFITNDQPLKRALGENCLLLSEITLG